METKKPELNFNYDQVCEFGTVGCEESGFTVEGLKKHNQEFISKHLSLIKKKLEQTETKKEEELSKIKDDQVDIAQILCKLSQKVEKNENKTQEILIIMNETLKKLEKLEENGKMFLGQKLKADKELAEMNNKNGISNSKESKNNLTIKKEKDNVEDSDKSNKNEKNAKIYSKNKDTNSSKKNAKKESKENMYLPLNENEDKNGTKEIQIKKRSIQKK